ncbi:hypothetical protein [Terasakiella sp. SH-1]|uniref:hypothetical protein n=1 Tax=Terasakiella sp. SH-1 TaxID=2560057 RepID=UPI001074157F|nr:hypothetical protein [Terasakiella sp. SH-1]
MRFTFLCCLVLLVAGCQTVQMGHFSAPALIAFDPQQARQLAKRAEGYGYVKGRPFNLQNYPFFTQNSFGQNWLKQSSHKVITIGYPKECATYNARWRHRNLFDAIERTMTTCLSRVKEFSKHTGKKCGCRIAAINNNVFLTPEELPFRRNLPAIALVKDTRGRKEILGYASTTGRTGQNQPMDFFTQSGEKVCTGRYNLGSLSFKGDAQLNCFGGRIKGPAVFKVAGYREGQAYGTALVNAGENQLILVYGLPTDEFRKRRAELLEE